MKTIIRLFCLWAIFLLALTPARANSCEMANNDAPLSFTISEYRSNTLSGYELVVIEPWEGGLIYLLQTEDSIRLLKIDDDSSPAGKGQPLLDKMFTSALYNGDNNTFTLFNQQQQPSVFHEIKVKRNTFPVAPSYSYGNDSVYGLFHFKTIDPLQYSFTLETNDGTNACSISGEITLKGVLGFYSGNQIDGALGDCSFVCWFSKNQVQVFMLSDPYFCACTHEATVSHIYTDGD